MATLKVTNIKNESFAGDQLYLKSDGKIGIGTTDPDAPLTIHNSTDPEVRFGYNASQDHRISWDSSKIYMHADPDNANGSSAIGLAVDGTLRLYINDSGNVGIGTTNPLFPSGGGIEIYNSSVPRLKLSNSTTGSTASDGSQIYLSANDLCIDHKENGNIKFYTAGITKATLDVSGHLGLGITPSDVDSIGKALNIASSTGGAIYLQDTDSPTTKFAAISYNGGTAALQIHAHHSSSYIDLGTNGTERLRIDNNGKVLIATTTTSEVHANNDELIIGSSSDDANHGLTIVTPDDRYGTVAFSDGSDGKTQGLLEYNHNGDYMRIYTAAGERFRVASDGRILLGTQKSFSGQTYYDDITINNSDTSSGAAGGTGISLISGNNTWGAILFGDSDDDDVGYIKYAHNGNYMRFGTDAGIRFRIDSDGVKFNGDTASANGLDDYEEGTWTPTIYGGTTAGSYSYEAVRTGGKYTKIGNMVYIEGVVRISSINSAGAGDLYIGGIPFATSGPPASSWTIGKGVQVFHYGTSNNSTADDWPPPFVGTASGGQSAFNIRSYGKNYNLMPAITDLSASNWIYQIAGWYPVS